MGYADVILEDAPVGYWRLGEASANAIDSISTNSLSPVGTLTRQVAGALVGDTNGAVVADGSTGYFSASSATGFPSGTTSRTVEAWVLPNGTIPWSTTGAGGTVFSTGVSSSVSFHFNMVNDSGTTYLYSDGVNGDSNISVAQSHMPTINIWSYVVFVITSTTWAYYLNAVLTDSGSWTLHSSVTPTSTRIGYRVDGHYFWNGELDEVAFYNKALSATRILAHYNEGAFRGGVTY